MDLPKNSQPIAQNTAGGAVAKSRRIVLLTAASAIVAAGIAATLLPRPSSDRPAGGEWKFMTRSPLTARFSHEDGDAVVLQSADGTQTQVPLAELLPADISKVTAWSRSFPAQSGGRFLAKQAAAALLPVEIRLKDGTSQMLPTLIVQLTGTQAFLMTLLPGDGTKLEKAFAIVEDERGVRRVPLTPYAITATRSGNGPRLIFSGPSKDLPAPLEPNSFVEVADGERLRFTACEIVTAGGRDSFAYWTHEAEAFDPPDMGSSIKTKAFRLSTDRAAIGIVETLQGAPVAVVFPAARIGEKFSRRLMYLPFSTDWIPPTYPHVFQLFAVKPSGSKTARFVVQVFDPEKKITDLRLWGNTAERFDDPPKMEIVDDRWANRPAGGFELKLTEGTPERLSSGVLDPTRWPHVRFWSGRFEVGDRMSTLEYQLVNVDGAGKRSHAGQAHVEHIFDISSPEKP